MGSPAFCGGNNMPWTNDQTWALVNKPQPEEIRLVDIINKPDPEEIYHHGTKGMRCGIRRYQNPDGTLTPEGKKRYLNDKGYPNDKGLKAAKKHKSLEEEFIRLAAKKQEDIEKEREEYLKKHENDKPVDNSDLLKAARNTIVSGQQVKDLMNKKNIDYELLYLEMAEDGLLDMESEDNDDYKIAEAAWYLKHKDDKN